MKKIIFITFLFSIIIIACDDDVQDNGNDLEHIEYNPTMFELRRPMGFPPPRLNPDNPLTEEGISLGRHLFYDPILSLDSTISCESCHKQTNSFAADVALSLGVGGAVGERNSMSLINMAFNHGEFFWDGSAASLEEQVLLPVENPIEMHEMWPNVIEKLKQHENYPTMFRQSFGISDKKEITKELAANAITQFIKTIISSDSKYDKVEGFSPASPRPFYEDDEERGRFVFFTETGIPFGEAECIHCHTSNGQQFTDQTFRNNGLDAVQDVNDFMDKGRGDITMLELDYGKFKVPTLRNLSMTGPYMHDGRFETLEEVLEHYNEHIKQSPTLDPILGDVENGIGLSDQKISDLLAFLKTLDDYSIQDNPDYSSPF